MEEETGIRFKVVPTTDPTLYFLQQSLLESTLVPGVVEAISLWPSLEN